MSYEENIVTLKKDDNTFCKIHLFGATVIDFTFRNTNYLFLSSKAVLNGKSAIRGGIPLVFPNFGPWNCGPQHGFARISWWKLEQPPTTDEKGDVRAIFTLEDNDETRQMWPYKFKLRLVVDLLEDGLKTSLEVFNKDDAEISFTCLLHNYFNVSDVSSTRLIGLENSEYIDKINDKRGKVDEKELSFDGLIDSIYCDTQMEHEILAKSAKIRLIKENLPDTVVWNPWEEKASKMADMGDGEWKKMLCVEAGRVVDPVILGPGALFEASQFFQIIQ